MITSDALPHRLEQALDIDAERETVFRFFTDDRRWASWWGPGSTIDPRPGGAILIRYPGGVEVTGEVVEIETPERIVFTYGYVSGAPIPPASSLVTIRLEAAGDSTRVHLTHAFADPAVCEMHVQGWRYQLSVFSNLVYDEIHSGAQALVEAWFEAWSAADAGAIRAALLPIAAEGIRMRDKFSAVQGLDALVSHIAAARRFMPGLTMRPAGTARHCQGTAVCDWVATAADGSEKGRGTNVFTLRADGRIASVTGFWNG